MLTLYGDKAHLQKQIEQLKQETLRQKDEELHTVKEELTSMRSQMNDVLEVLKIAKTKNGMIGKNRTMLDEKGRLTFGYVNSDNGITEVKIPLEGVEIAEGVKLTEQSSE